MREGWLFGGGPDGTGNATGNVKTLDRLAADLRLTPMQKAFAEVLAADKERNQTRAARAAGCGYKRAFQPLATEPFAIFERGTRTVHPDGHVEVGEAYYLVPAHLLGQQLEVRWDARMVRVFHGPSASARTSSTSSPRWTP